MSRANLVREELERCGIEYLLWLPDSEVRTFYECLLASEKLRLVQVCREDEAMGICAGLHLGGKRGAVLIQNAGLYTACDAIRGIILDLGLPLLLMVGYKGYRGMVEGKKSADTAAVHTEPLLQMFGIRHYMLDGDEDVENIGRAYRESMATSKPVAVLITREYN